jgi:protein MpaA
MTSVPADLIVPTGPDTLAHGTNPINGRRGGTHPLDGAPVCLVDPAAADPCLTVTLDALGLAVTGGPATDRARRRGEAIEVVQLDAGLPPTGVADEALLRYLGIWPGSDVAGAAEVRRIGTSAQGRPLTALRYGDGPRVVLAVAQTHGDEEAGRRVWLRARQQALPAGVTLWVVPMLNPDGLAADTRFLADGADPNRAAGAEPEQKAVIALATAVRPVLTVWYHQNYGWIGGSGASMAPATRYHEVSGLGPLYRSGDCKLGFMWCPIDDALGSSSILVELPDVVTPNDVQVHARALLAVVGEAAP